MAKKTPHKLNMHAKKRAEERYGINLNKHARREIVQMIQTNSEQAQFVAKESNNRTLWRINYQNENLNVVYDKLRETLATVLPKEAVEFQCSTAIPNESDVQKGESCRKVESRGQITDELRALWKDDQSD
jgi:hypothetical protein